MSASAAIAELTAGFEAPFGALGRAGGASRSAADSDRDAVVIAWPSVPVEIVRAAGFRPVLARGSAAPTPAADRVIEADLFPSRHRQLVEAALTGRLANVAAVVLPRTSDADYKCFLYLRELARLGAAPRLPPVWLFDLLQSGGAEVPAYDRERARDLHERLASLAGRKADADELSAQIALANRARAAARRLAALRLDAPRLTGAEAVPLLGAFWQLDPERYAGLAAEAGAALAARPPLSGARILLAGAPVDDAALHRTLEAEGAVVVAESSPIGTGAARPDVDAAGDPVAALAEHYRRESIDARLPVAALMAKIDAALGGVDAVVVSLPPDDASFGWDYPRLRALLERRAIPHAVLESDPFSPPTAAERERIRGLLDEVGRRREARRG
ncbi:MAG TPA: 2-hydroxyacyl-CoA dehydratase family protein [Gammaproteobacteria bacterium]